MKTLGASDHQLVDVYIKQVRSVLELAVPVWHSSLTVADKISIERVQKSALQIILGLEYDSYKSTCHYLDLETLEVWRQKLCKKFCIKTVKNAKHTKWFKVNTKTSKTRQQQP